MNVELLSRVKGVESAEALRSTSELAASEGAVLADDEVDAPAGDRIDDIELVAEIERRRQASGVSALSTSRLMRDVVTIAGRQLLARRLVAVGRPPTTTPRVNRPPDRALERRRPLTWV
jgi:hypothetical protein